MQRRFIPSGYGKFIKSGKNNRKFSLLLPGLSTGYLTLSHANWGSYDRAKFAISFWFKRIATGTGVIMAKGDGTTATTEWLIRFTSDKLEFVTTAGGVTDGQLVTTATYTSTTAWQHALIHYDSANGTTGNRMRIWIDGTEVTVFDVDDTPTTSVDTLLQNIAVGATNSGATPAKTCLIHQLAFFSGSLPAASSLRDSVTGKPLNPSAVAGFFSMLTASNGNVAFDSGKGLNWTAGNEVVAAAFAP